MDVGTNIDFMYNEEETKYISLEGKEVTNTEVFTNNKIFAKKQDNKWGFVDASGTKIIDFKYDKVTEVNNYGFAGIKQNEKWGVIDADGKISITNANSYMGIRPKICIGNTIFLRNF